MLSDIKAKFAWLFRTIIVFTPWVVSIYFFYWLDYQVWTIDTPHRGKLSVVLMSTGMLISFFLWTYFNKQKK